MESGDPVDAPSVQSDIPGVVFSARIGARDGLADREVEVRRDTPKSRRKDRVTRLVPGGAFSSPIRAEG
jgi:hypothetical protein